MQENKVTAHKKLDSRRSERGSAILVAIMFMAILVVISLAAAKVRVASAHDIDSHETQQKEYWGARSGAAVIEASVRSDIPARFASDLQNAKYLAGGQALPAFDARSVSPSQTRPVVDADGNRTSYPLSSCTSLLGQIDDWAQSRISIPESYASGLGFRGRVAALREAYRQQMASSVPTNEPAYVLEFSIDAAAGENGHVRPSGTLMLGPAVIGCNTSVTLDASPSTIIQGSPSSLVITYTNANRIVVTDGAGNTVADQSVTEASPTQTLTIPVTPSTTTTYTAVATSSAGCSATSAPRTITVNVPPPQIVSFSANPSCIVQGNNSTLTWTITGATAATINGAPVNPSSGTLVVTPSATTTYTLVATNTSGSVQAQVVVSVSVPPRINLFSANPSCMMPGSGAVLRWNISDAVSVTINGTPVNPAVGTMNVNPGSDTVYTIVATGAGCNAQTVQAQTTVQVATRPTINLFSANPSSYINGGSSVLQWNISGAVSATINGAPVNPSSGTMTVSPSVTTTYTLVATSGGCSPQQAQAQVTVTVSPKPPDPVVCPTINTFNAAQSCLMPGQSTSLQWAVSNADTVTINGSPVNPASGSVTVNPAATTTYTLVASRSGCTPLQAQVVVQVGSVPRINSFTAASGTIQQGSSTSLSWDVSNAATVTIDGVSVNPASGSIPVTPSGTHTYTLIATSGGCSPQQTQSQVTVNVTACPSIAYFTASPPSIVQGSSSVLQWSASDAVAVTLNGAPVPVTGSMTVTPATTTTYRLLAQSSSGGCDIERFVTVNVSSCAAPQIASFTANPSTVNQGGNSLVRLSWSINETTGTGVTVTISPGVGSFNGASGFVDITQPQGTTTYTIVATNGCGATSSAQTTVTVNPPACTGFNDPLPAGSTGGPIIKYFASDAPGNRVFPFHTTATSNPPPRKTADLLWEVEGADTVTINGVPTSLMAIHPQRVCGLGWGAPSNCTNYPATYPVSPTSDTTYVLEAWNSANPSRKVTAKLTIQAVPLTGFDASFIGATTYAADPTQLEFSWAAWFLFNEANPTEQFNSVDITNIGTNLPPGRLAGGIFGTGLLVPKPAVKTTYTMTGTSTAGRSVTRSFTYDPATEAPTGNQPGWFAEGISTTSVRDSGGNIWYPAVGMGIRRTTSGVEFFGRTFSTYFSSGCLEGNCSQPSGGINPVIYYGIYKDGVLIKSGPFTEGGSITLFSSFGSFGQGTYVAETIPYSDYPGLACGRIDIVVSAAWIPWNGFSGPGATGPFSDQGDAVRFTGTQILLDTRMNTGWQLDPLIHNPSPAMTKSYVYGYLSPAGLPPGQLKNTMTWTPGSWSAWSERPTCVPFVGCN